MGKIAGFRLRDRWAGWTRQPFNSDSASQVAERGDDRVAALRESDRCFEPEA